MRRNKAEVKKHIAEMLKNGWTKENIANIGHCPTCGAFGFEGCEPDCPTFLEWVASPECQAEVLADQTRIAEIKAGWDSAA
jgi:hypothetical protein